MAQMVGTLPLMTWISEHYTLTTHERICKRCGMDVMYLTKHAVNVHGDAIDVLPVVQSGMTDTDFDHEGRRHAV